jgi:hypothetical protein
VIRTNKGHKPLIVPIKRGKKTKIVILATRDDRGDARRYSLRGKTKRNEYLLSSGCA